MRRKLAVLAVPRSGWPLPDPGAGLLALWVVVAAACGGKVGGSIPCTTDAECPHGLVCDAAGGSCHEPGEDQPYDCSPPLPGCACATNSPPLSCLGNDQDPALVESCRRGRSICIDEVYQPCEVAADPSCEAVGVSAGDFDLDEDNSSQLELGPEGELVLDPEVEQVSFGYLWIANTGENTVSKLDIDTGREVARYASVRGSAALGVPAVPPGGFAGDQQDCGNCPSRTAIDFAGDAFTANRAFDRQGTVTKFANAVADCVDHDGDGAIATSADVDGDGWIDVDDPAEFLGEDDECILWTVPVGDDDGVPRALAIDAGGPDGEAGNLWVGLYNEGRVVQLSGDTGAPIVRGGNPVSVRLNAGGGLSPYGAAVDGGGHLWVTGLFDGSTTYLAKVNTFDGTLIQMYGIPDDDDGCSESYGIAIDVAQRIWLGGWECRDLKAFDQDTEEWHRTDRDGESNTRGVAVDAIGNVYVAFSDGAVGKLRADDIIALGTAAPMQKFTLPPVEGARGGPIGQTIGVGVDRNGACWAVSRNDGAAHGAATRIDPDGTLRSHPVGHRPYTYSDFTGFGLATIVRPSGFWRGVLEGCAASGALSDWTTLEWFERQPPGTSVKMRLRVADTVAALATAPWFGPWDDSPVELTDVPDARFMQVEAQLSTTDPLVSPSFNGFIVRFECPPIDSVP